MFQELFRDVSSKTEEYLKKEVYRCVREVSMVFQGVLRVLQGRIQEVPRNLKSVSRKF